MSISVNNTYGNPITITSDNSQNTSSNTKVAVDLIGPSYRLDQSTIDNLEKRMMEAKENADADKSANQVRNELFYMTAKNNLPQGPKMATINSDYIDSIAKRGLTIQNIDDMILNATALHDKIDQTYTDAAEKQVDFTRLDKSLQQAKNNYSNIADELKNVFNYYQIDFNAETYKNKLMDLFNNESSKIETLKATYQEEWSKFTSTETSSEDKQQLQQFFRDQLQSSEATIPTDAANIEDLSLQEMSLMLKTVSNAYDMIHKGITSTVTDRTAVATWGLAKAEVSVFANSFFSDSIKDKMLTSVDYAITEESAQWDTRMKQLGESMKQYRSDPTITNSIDDAGHNGIYEQFYNISSNSTANSFSDKIANAVASMNFYNENNDTFLEAARANWNTLIDSLPLQEQSNYQWI